MTHQHPLQHLVGQLRHGDLSRRQFMQAATALGIGTATASLLAQGEAASQEASPAASPEATTAVAPTAGTEGQERGAGGDLRII